ncbi:hypothetical protein [Marinomonas algarum]|uniref:Uncharacterized protein n=1 Tax=Marinomonas algarum TaxID=2883105 RepID=A0A9X1ILA5_9GAMM|nr:hypothetical protein [Marinomonas algarum]MCB5161343.1 hypothetical protein [Marinomonas algarum]
MKARLPATFYSHQGGWVMIEMMLCLVLFSVVLHLAQQQSKSHWQTIQLSHHQQRIAINKDKQSAMANLTHSSFWRSVNGTYAIEKKAYPNCVVCRGDSLKQWFSASLYGVYDGVDDASDSVFPVVSTMDQEETP